MMTERSYEDAVQILRRRIGGRWEGRQDTGRGEMVAALKHDLGYDNDEANAAIEEMIRTGQLHYHPYDNVDTSVTPGLPSAVTPTGPQATGGAAGMPAAPIPGYWEIGGDEGGFAGRAGQVAVDY
jgi:hypothetical protein